jgi:hypothetical protein
MAKENKAIRKSPEPIKKPLIKPVKSRPKSLFENIEENFQKNQIVIFSIAGILSLLFGLFLFDVKISEANDDSLYVEAGYNFAKNFRNYYTANAPLYPMLLSIPIYFAGINIILLKSFSLIFSILHILFLFLAFRKRLPLLVLFPVLFIIAVNSSFQYFASQTFTESFFMMLQALFIWAFIKVYENENKGEIIPSNWKQWLMLGLISFLTTLCKNLAIASLLVLVFYFVINLRFRQIAFTIISFAAFKIPFEILKGIIWGNNLNQYSSQTGMLLQKDPYDPSKGQENLSGFIDRFFGNINLYVSKRLFQILGFKSIDDLTVNSGLSFLVILLLFVGLIVIFKNRNKLMLFIALYTLAMMAATFILLQTRWDQPRMILVYVPFILLTILYSIYYFLKKKSSILQSTYVIIIAVLFFSSFISSIAKSVTRFPILKKNLAGDIYYGYTQDWQNYLKMSRYVGDSLPSTAYVACRKAPMSFVYGKGKKFYPVYTVISTDPDTVLSTFKKEGVTHFILASLRRDPKKIDGMIINTLHRMMGPVQQKYPQKLILLKQIGETEPAYLYEIKY